MKRIFTVTLGVLRALRPTRGVLLAALAVAGAGCVLVGVERLLGLEAALILGGVAAVAVGLMADNG